MDNIHNITSVGTRQTHADYSRDPEQICRDTIFSLEAELTKNPKSVKSLRSWIASYHALSVLYMEDGQVEAAQQCLLIPHRSMMHMANCSNGDEEQRLIATNALRLTLPPLLEFSRKYPPCDNCVRELEAQRKALETDDTVYH
ncbi:hypothetical protein L3Q72_17535 [Vibrio sp. JC009]|uniref:hypothetical protein n=1 Tax=Vibrio sp. JC009 TaxID=2912314 RepID=UPI0023AE9F31|nr:hypothetical protein [Vibrio sp. JC009]WED24678.1 hypothetical protein L3Q72_17535 [Vibrio sp. JC009]